MSVAATPAPAPLLPTGASSSAAQTNGQPLHPTPPELEQTLALLSAHRTVLGYLLLSVGHPVSIIRHSGVVFDGEQGRRYASAIGRIVESVRDGLEEIAGENTEVVSTVELSPGH